MGEDRQRCEAVYTGWRRPAQCMYVLDHSEDMHKTVCGFDGGITKHVEWDDGGNRTIWTYGRAADGSSVLLGIDSATVEFIGDIREPGA